MKQPAPSNCGECDVPMRHAKHPPVDGVKVHRGRGLCGTCYQRANNKGALPEYVAPVLCEAVPEPQQPKLRLVAVAAEPKYVERRQRGRHEVRSEYEHLRSFGVNDEQIAEQLGMKVESLYRSLKRSKGAA